MASRGFGADHHSIAQVCTCDSDDTDDVVKLAFVIDSMHGSTHHRGMRTPSAAAFVLRALLGGCVAIGLSACSLHRLPAKLRAGQGAAAGVGAAGSSAGAGGASGTTPSAAPHRPGRSP